MLKTIEASDLKKILEAHKEWAQSYYDDGEGSFDDPRRADLREADLHGLDLSNARLDGARLDGARLDGARLDGARLDGASLVRARLDGARLDGARLDGASLDGASLVRASLDGASLDGARLDGARLDGARLVRASLDGETKLPFEVPIVKDLDQKIYEAVTTGGGTLDMGSWHTCETTHCRAGWAITLAGPEAMMMEKIIGASAAGALIYAASRPNKPIPDFYASNEYALASIREDAGIPVDA